MLFATILSTQTHGIIWVSSHVGKCKSNVQPPVISTAAGGNMRLCSSQMPHCVNQIFPCSGLDLGQVCGGYYRDISLQLATTIGCCSKQG